jgi:hypothetical protein
MEEGLLVTRGSTYSTVLYSTVLLLSTADRRSLARSFVAAEQTVIHSSSVDSANGLVCLVPLRFDEELKIQEQDLRNQSSDVSFFQLAQLPS